MSESLRQLTLVRFREFFREPEAVFWVFIFPILMSAGLGLAFRNRPAEVLKIGAADAQLAASLRGEGLSVEVLSETAADPALRTGRIVLLAIRGANGVVYRYDDTNPDARAARLLADRALQRSAGIREAVPVREQLVREPGSRYIDF
ncbi:MAG TPA: hypothetical protein VFL57_00850, partial [Bryobacteraceae bacterium]|nr:hypothetical protein [Bryobacteraceae bacterium]